MAIYGDAGQLRQVRARIVQVKVGQNLVNTSSWSQSAYELAEAKRRVTWMRSNYSAGRYLE
jgi:hypothetical protein